MRLGFLLYLNCTKAYYDFARIFPAPLCEATGVREIRACFVSFQPIRRLSLKFHLVAFQERGFRKFSGWDIFRPLVDREFVTGSR